jgi:hypothetical protein
MKPSKAIRRGWDRVPCPATLLISVRLLLRFCLPLDAFCTDLFVCRPHCLEFLIARILNVHHLISSGIGCINQFVELEVDRAGVAVLGVLYKENHEKGDYGRSSVDDQLPGIREMKQRSCHCPYCDDKDGTYKSPLRAQSAGCGGSELTKPITFAFSDDLGRNFVNADFAGFG